MFSFSVFPCSMIDTYYLNDFKFYYIIRSEYICAFQSLIIIMLGVKYQNTVVKRESSIQDKTRIKFSGCIDKNRQNTSIFTKTDKITEMIDCYHLR